MSGADRVPARTLALLVAIALLLPLTACGDEPETAVAATQDCAEPENPPQQSGSHLIGDVDPPVPWSSTPPTSGWHASGSFEIAISDASAPLSEARQVSVLEAGGVVVAYRDIGEADVAALTEHVTANQDGRVAVTPYDAIGRGQVVFTGWGVLQRCAGLDLAALDAFTAAYAEDNPEPPGH